MRIENNLNNKVSITTIKEGECFIYNGTLHMRVNAGSIRYNNSDIFPVVIVDLEKNRLNSLKNCAEVIKIDAKIVVEKS